MRRPYEVVAESDHLGIRLFRIWDANGNGPQTDAAAKRLAKRLAKRVERFLNAPANPDPFREES